jgi:sulfur carrier protein
MVSIVFNGQSRRISSNLTVAQLLQQLELTPQHIAVEINEQLVPRERHQEHVLREGDRLEVVTLVGGG